MSTGVSLHCFTLKGQGGERLRGDEDVIVFFSIRGSDGVLYEILDDDLNVIATLSMQDFIGLYKVQQDNPEK